MGLFGEKTPQKRYSKAVRKLCSHIIDESIDGFDDYMREYRLELVSAAATAWIDLREGVVDEESARNSAHADIFVHPRALKTSPYYSHALDLTVRIQDEFVHMVMNHDSNSSG